MPSANRNTYSVATLIIHIPRVEALHASTLGYEIATPSELPRVRTIPSMGYLHLVIGHVPYTTIPYQEPGRASSSSSNSDGVAIPQPRVAGEARYPG